MLVECGMLECDVVDVAAIIPSFGRSAHPVNDANMTRESKPQTSRFCELIVFTCRAVVYVNAMTATLLDAPLRPPIRSTTHW